MTQEIKQRIKQLRLNKTPDGYKKTAIGVIPQDWEVVRFKKLFSRLTRRNTELNKNVLTISAQYGLISQEEFFNKTVASENTETYFLLNKGDFAYNKSYSNGYPFGAIKSLTKYDKGIVSPLYICFSVSEENKFPEFYNQYFEAGKFNREINAYAQEGARNHGLLNIAVEDFFNSLLIKPPLAEQQKIAEILSTQDKVIELQQKRIDELKKLKKAYLSKMFPQKGSNVPELRFKGFTGNWEQRRFSETFDFLQNNTLSRAELNMQNGKVKNVHYGDVLIKFGEFTDVQNTELSFISDDNIADKYSSAKLNNGDIVIADTAEDETVGKCTEIGNIGTIPVVSGLHTMPCRPKEDFAEAYLGFFMNSTSYHDQLFPFMQGIKVSSISKSSIQETVIKYPKDKAEQQKIGSFFRNLNHLITLQSRKLDAEKLKKKSLMQLLLTGIVRVK